jgi:hypothetical protein
MGGKASWGHFWTGHEKAMIRPQSRNRSCDGVAYTTRMSFDVVEEIFEHLPGRGRVAMLEDARFGNMPLCDEITVAKVWPLRLLLPFLQHCIDKAEMGIRVFTNAFDLINVAVSVSTVAIALREFVPLFS